MLNFAILGAGRMAHTMAKTVRKLDDVALYAVAARERSRASAFAAEYGMEKYFDSYEEMVQDPAVDLVYIATTHNLHAQHMKLCIACEKPVLCEKPFTMNAAEAAEIIALAREKGVFVCEAMWTRFLPILHDVVSVLYSGIIGEIKQMRADFCTNILYKERMVSPELGGGALLDLGVYCLTAAAILFGSEVAAFENRPLMTERGVDLLDKMTLRYTDGRIADLTCAMDREAPPKIYVYGEDGYMEIDNLTNWQKAVFYKRGGGQIWEICCPPQISGYEYEILAVKEAVENGKKECAQMPHTETMRVMRWMDKLREDSSQM